MPVVPNISTQIPSGNPTFTILIDNTPMRGNYSVVSVVITKMVNKISSAKLSLIDGDPSTNDFELSNTDLFLPGKQIEIKAGYDSTEDTIFKGIVIKHGLKVRQNSSFLQVECKHESVKTSVGKSSSISHDLKDSDVFENIISNYAIQKDIEQTQINHGDIVKYYSSDWDYLVSRAEANGMLVLTNDEKIKIAKPNLTSSPKLSLQYGSTILEFDAEMDSRNQIEKVKSYSWDIANQEVLEQESDTIAEYSQGNLQSSDLSSVIGLENYELQHSGNIPDTELKAWANAQMLKSKLSKIEGKVKSMGYADINPGDIVALQGVGDRFNGNAFVTGVRHELGNGNWHTDLQFGLSEKWFTEDVDIHSKPASNLLSGVNGLQTGIVTKLESDPKGEERIQIKLPIINKDDDGVWARISSLDAGNNRGSFFRPEIGDEVLVGFLNDDPRNAVVLGMLNSSAKPAPIVASDDNHEKGFVTRSEMKLIFNDDKKDINIQTPAGKSIVISEDKGSIVISDENNNKITMDSNGINIESGKDVIIKASGDVKIEGVNINLKASAELKAEANAAMELKASGTNTVKGAMVQIN
ncbi:MAG: type VI secretion system tip protein VgrG [Bacteroidales bacterium]|jgi:Rhs element Vgr protein